MLYEVITEVAIVVNAADDHLSHAQIVIVQLAVLKLFKEVFLQTYSRGVDLLVLSQGGVKLPET